MKYIIIVVFSLLSVFGYSQENKSNISSFVDFAAEYSENYKKENGTIRPPEYEDIIKYEIFDDKQNNYYSLQYFYDLSNILFSYDKVVHAIPDKSYEDEYIYLVANFNDYLSKYFEVNYQESGFDKNNFETWFLRLLRNFLKNIWYNYGNDSIELRLNISKSVLSCITNSWEYFSKQSKMQIFMDVTFHTDIAIEDITNLELIELCKVIKENITKLYKEGKT